METLYCLSIKKHDEYHEHSVYTSFQNALLTIYDIGLDKLSLLIETEGTKKAKKHVIDLKELNSIRTDYEPDKVTYLFDKKFRITKIHSLLTSKVAFENIIEHINDRFRELKHMRTTKKICFPLDLLDEKTKNKWYLLDEFNAGEVIQHLEKHIQRRIDELKIIHSEVVQGILERNNEDFIAVRFTDSQEFLLNKEIFAIVVSPNTGYTKSLTSS
jgi:hypothetical protein